MALIDLLDEQKSCPRCNACKWIPLEQYNASDTQAICPSLEKYQFHTYSGGGKLHACIAINEGKVPLDMSVADVAYKCNLCGACDYICKIYRKDMDLCENFEELRIACAEAGLTPDVHKQMMDNLSSCGDFYGRVKENRIDWTVNTAIKCLSDAQTGDVFFHAGYDALYSEKGSEKIAKTANLLMSKGIDLVTAGSNEATTGYEAFALGHIMQAKAAAQEFIAQVHSSGAKTLVTMDAHSYMTLRYYYPKHNLSLGIDVLHITELLANMLKDGRLTLTGSVNATVTYHDPCYLGRRSEAYKPYSGPKETRPMAHCRTGQLGVYDAPRALLSAIPGLKLIEMDRTKGYAWCCGGGAGVAQAYPELASFSAKERIREAKSTQAEILVTACPTCVYMLDSVSEDLPVIDLIDLVLNSEGGKNHD